jgi:hypothetical protein
MIVKPIIINSILYGELSPWRSNLTDANYRDILNNRVRVNKEQPELFFSSLTEALNDYSINIKLDHTPNTATIANLAKFANLAKQSFSILTPPSFFDKASEFYLYLIINERIRILAAIVSNLCLCKSDIDSVFQTVNLLKNLEYSIEQTANKNYTDKLSTYVLNALKITLFRLYSEIITTFPNFIGDEALTEAELINILAPDFETDKNIPGSNADLISKFISSIEASTISAPKPTGDDKVKIANDKAPFNQKPTDFRDGFKGKLDYGVIANSKLFIDFEMKLYEYDYIDLEYNYTNKHNKKKELAALFHLLIQKKVFKEKYIKHPSSINKAEYRQYLDHRYNVNTSQEFSRFDPAYIEVLKTKYYWIDLLLK